MSALGSSVINKSSSKIKPKAAPTRRAPASSQTSARASVDRQTFSQTPQPQSTLPNAASSPTPAPSISQSTPVVSQQATAVAQAAAQNAISTFQNAKISRNEDSGPAAESTPQKRSRDSDAVSIPRPSARASSIRDTSVPVRVSPSESITPAPQTRQTSPPVPPTFAPGTSESLTEQPEQPAKKRRRIQRPQQKTPFVEGTAAGPDEALPTTENGESSREIADASPATPPPSQVYSPFIHKSAEPAQPTNKTRKPRLPTKAKGKQRAIDDAAADIVADAVRGSMRKKKGAARARKSKASEKDLGAETIEDADEGLVADGVKKKGRKRKKREVTPDDAEDVQIVPGKVLMSDLTRNLRTGKKSTREMELQEMDQEAKAKRKQKRIDKRNGLEDQPSTNETPIETAEERLERLAPRANETLRAVPNTIIVDGQIRIDESTLVIDRHAEAAVERDAEQLEAIEESELTRRVNSASWGKRDKSGGWNEMLTDQFYDGLRMFGTDFSMISKMFPGRSRHSVKLKFNKEERDDPRRIERTLKGERLPVDMDAFQKMTDTVFSDPKELEKEMEEDKKRIEEEEAAAKAALEEALKQRADEAAAEAEAADKEAAENDSSAKENQGGQEAAEEGEPAPSQTKVAKRKKAVKSGQRDARQRNKAHNKATKAKVAGTRKGQAAGAKKALGTVGGGRSKVQASVLAQ